jgi:anti-sigma regulatory factor (Ser/Thr protein kinase)
MAISCGQAAAVAARTRDDGDRDCERLRLLESNRELARVNRAQADFFANVSHDLRSPLTGLREFVSIILEGLAGPVTDRQTEYLHIALRNADTLAEMIEQLLAITRIQQGSFRLARKRVSIARFLDRDSLLHGAAHGGKEVRLELTTARGLPEVFIDPDRILEAIRNLVDNAIKYSRDPVEIRIGASRASCGGVEIAVQDNGPGIDPLTLKQIFKRFSRGDHARRVRPGGLGLGLTIVQEIVDLHGGRVGVKSAPGEGSVFSLTLPPYQPRVVVGCALRSAWRRTADAGGFAFVRARAQRWEGALHPSAEQLGGQIREAMARCLGVQDEVVAAMDSDPEVCFIIAGEPAAVGPHARRCLRTITDRLRLQVGAHVEWQPRPDKVHSCEFHGPEEMTDAVLRWFDHEGGNKDVE